MRTDDKEGMIEQLNIRGISRNETTSKKGCLLYDVMYTSGYCVILLGDLLN